MMKVNAEEISKLFKNDVEGDYIGQYYYFNDINFMEEDDNYDFTLHGHSNKEKKIKESASVKQKLKIFKKM